ncbi:flippase [Rubripirellula reticaptiva]|nr:flippase [Rubripirellula reticaptiva]
MLRKALKNSGWIFGCGVLSNITAFVASVMAARYLDVTEIGAIGYAASIVAMLRIFVSLGIDEVACREISQEPDSSPQVITSSMAIRLTAAAITIPAIVAFALFMTPQAIEGRAYILVIMSLGLFGVPFSSASIHYASHLRSAVPQRINATLAILYMAMVAIGVQQRLSTGYFVSLIAAQQALGGLIVYWIYRSNEITDARWSLVRKTAKSLLHDSWPQTLSGFGILIQAYSDQIMLGEMKGLDSVAQYSVALKMTTVMTFAPLAILASFLPSLSRRFKSDQNSFWIGFHQANRLASILCVAIVTIVYFIGAKLVLLTFGDQYSGAAVLLSVMSMRIFLTCLGIIRGSFLVNANILQYSMLTVLIGTVLNILLNLKFIPSHAEFGAVYASLISFLVTTVIVDLLFSKTRQAMLIAMRGWAFPFLNYENQVFRI